MPPMPETLHAVLAHVAEEHAIEPAHILGSCVVLDAKGSGPADTETVPCEREDGVSLVPAVQDPFTAARGHPGRYGADG